VRIRVVAVILGMIAGLAAGVGAYTFVYAKGYSYLTNDPAACANCHVMGQYYGGWMKGPHKSVAVCNDCHAPHDFFGKYSTKARNGFWHSFYFTTGRYPDNLEITKRNLAVTENACRHCHEDIVQAIDNPGHRTKMSCLRCHWDVGHM